MTKRKKTMLCILPILVLIIFLWDIFGTVVLAADDTSTTEETTEYRAWKLRNVKPKSRAFGFSPQMVNIYSTGGSSDSPQYALIADIDSKLKDPERSLYRYYFILYQDCQRNWTDNTGHSYLYLYQFKDYRTTSDFEYKNYLPTYVRTGQSNGNTPYMFFFCTEAAFREKTGYNQMTYDSWVTCYDINTGSMLYTKNYLTSEYSGRYSESITLSDNIHCDGGVDLSYVVYNNYPLYSQVFTDYSGAIVSIRKFPTDEIDLTNEHGGTSGSFDDIEVNYPDWIYTIKTWIDGLSGTILEPLAKVLDGMLSIFSDIYAKIYQIGSFLWDLPSKIAEAIGDIFKKLFVPSNGFFQEKFDTAYNKFAFVTDLKKFGSDIVEIIEDFDISQAPAVTVHLSKSESKILNFDDTEISFDWFARYKPVTDLFISGFLWIVFIWNVYGALPSIINGTGTIKSKASLGKDDDD